MKVMSCMEIVINLSLRLKTVPDPWKESNVIPVHKKDNTSDLNNYRPISLLSNAYINT